MKSNLPNIPVMFSSGFPSAILCNLSQSSSENGLPLFDILVIKVELCEAVKVGYTYVPTHPWLGYLSGIVNLNFICVFVLLAD